MRDTYRHSALLLLVAQLAAVATAFGVASVTLSDVAHGSQLEQPAAAVRTRHVDACATDEGPDGQGSRPCVWDARHMGNGLGRSFIVRRDGRLQYLGHSRAHALVWGESR